MHEATLSLMPFETVMYKDSEIQFVKISLKEMDLVGPKSLNNIAAWALARGLNKSTRKHLTVLREKYTDQPKGWEFAIVDGEENLVSMEHYFSEEDLDITQTSHAPSADHWRDPDIFIFELA